RRPPRGRRRSRTARTVRTARTRDLPTPATRRPGETTAAPALRPTHHGEPAVGVDLSVVRAPFLLGPGLRVRRRAPSPGEGVLVAEHAVGHPLVGAVQPLHVMV